MESSQNLDLKSVMFRIPNILFVEKQKILMNMFKRSVGFNFTNLDISLTKLTFYLGVKWSRFSEIVIISSLFCSGF